MCLSRAGHVLGLLMALAVRTQDGRSGEALGSSPEEAEALGRTSGGQHQLREEWHMSGHPRSPGELGLLWHVAPWWFLEQPARAVPVVDKRRKLHR